MKMRRGPLWLCKRGLRLVRLTRGLCRICCSAGNGCSRRRVANWCGRSGSDMHGLCCCRCHRWWIIASMGRRSCRWTGRWKRGRMFRLRIRRWCKVGMLNRSGTSISNHLNWSTGMGIGILRGLCLSRIRFLISGLIVCAQAHCTRSMSIFIQAADNGRG